MNTFSRLVIVSLVMANLACSGGGAGPREFLAANGEIPRRDVCIRLIDGGQVARGVSRGQIQKLFGDRVRFTGAIDDREELKIAVVALVENRDDRDRGWRLVLKFTEKDILWDYYLSNVHK